MRKLNVRFMGGVDTVLVSTTRNTIFSYEQNTKELHETYGGKQYYVSQSGLSGAGFLEFGPKNDLILFGYYRTDAVGEQKKEIVHQVEMNNNGKMCDIFGYAPIISHKGVDQNAPFVLTDGTNVAFVMGLSIVDTLLNWEECIRQGGKKMECVYYDKEGGCHKKNFSLYNPYHFRGVRATKFVDLRDARQEAVDYEWNWESIFEKKLCIVKKGDTWYHLGPDRIFDQKWEKDPRKILGEVANGWIHAGDGLYWRRKGINITVFLEKKLSSLCGGKFSEKEYSPEWANIQKNISLIEWFSKTTGEWHDILEEEIIRREEKDLDYIIGNLEK